MVMFFLRKIWYVGWGPWLFLLMYALFLMWRINQHPLHFYTVDGGYFEQIAEAMVNRNASPWQLYISGEWRAPYQPLYPLLLASISTVSGFSALHLQMASAIFLSMAILLGVILWLGKSWYLFIPCFFFDHYVNIVCHMWSEGLMLVLLFFLLLIINFESHANHHRVSNTLISVILTCLLFTRHASLFIVLGFMAGLLLIKGDYKRILKISWLPILLYILWCGYLWYSTGYFTGGPRYFHHESIDKLTFDLLKGVVNIFLPIRDWDHTGLWLILLQLLMLGMMWYFLITATSEPIKLMKNEAVSIWFIVAAVYGLLMLSTRALFYFAEPLDERLMAPTSNILGWLMVYVLDKHGNKAAVISWAVLGMFSFLGAMGLSHVLSFLSIKKPA